jgi:hypothetical protein
MVSLVDLIYSVSPKVPIDPQVQAHIDEGLAQRTGPKRGPYWWWAKTWERVIKDSEAASALDQCLTNFPDRAPRWYDWGDHGRPKASEAARIEGHRLLVSCAQYLQRFDEATERGAFPFDGVGKADFGCVKPFEDDARYNKASEIGFVRDEIRSFLDYIGVPHSFEPPETPKEPEEPEETKPPETPSAVSGAQTVPADDWSSEVEADTGLPRHAEENLAQLMTEATTKADAKIGRNTDSIALRIREAVRAARLSSRGLVNAPLDDDILQHTAWRILISWAKGNEQGEPRKPLIGASKVLRVIIWEKDFDEHKMDFESFARRLDPSRRGPRKAKEAV